MTRKRQKKQKAVRLTLDYKNAADEEFDKLLKEFLVEKAPMLKRLSEK